MEIFSALLVFCAANSPVFSFETLVALGWPIWLSSSSQDSEFRICLLSITTYRVALKFNDNLNVFIQEMPIVFCVISDRTAILVTKHISCSHPNKICLWLALFFSFFFFFFGGGGGCIGRFSRICILETEQPYDWPKAHETTLKTWVNAPDDGVIKWKHFPRYWPFVKGIYWSPVDSPHKGQWCGALMFCSVPEQTVEQTVRVRSKSKKTLFQVGTVKQIKHCLLFEISASHRPESSLYTIYTTL